MKINISLSEQKEPLPELNWPTEGNPKKIKLNASTAFKNQAIKQLDVFENDAKVSGFKTTRLDNGLRLRITRAKSPVSWTVAFDGVDSLVLVTIAQV